MSSGSSQESKIIDPVGATSRATAAARARESERGDRLFLDVLAAPLAGDEGFAALDGHNAARAAGGEAVANPVFAIRTRFFDDLLLAEAGQRSVRQIVVIAAGLDTRAFRLPWPPGVDLYEVDMPQVLAYKDEVLTSLGAEPTCRRHAIGVDLREPWVPSLGRSRLSSEPACCVACGGPHFLFGRACGQKAVHRHRQPCSRW